MTTKFVIMTNTLCQGDIIGCHDGDDGHPCLFDTEDDAWREIADGIVTQLDQFIKGERARDETDFDCTEWVQEVYVSEDGLIVSTAIEKGVGGKILFDPKLKV